MDEKWTLRSLLIYCCRFLFCYCIFYYGSLFITGLSVPGGYYAAFIEKYFDYPALLRKALLYTTRFMLETFGYVAEVSDIYHVRIKNATGVKVVYSCLGIGILSFWAAFIIANKCRLQRKIVYVTAGLLFIFLLNALRLTLLVIAANSLSEKNKFIIQHHHTLFNIACYGLVMLMMIVYDTVEKKYSTL